MEELSNQAVMEQAEESLVQFATILGSYFRKLRQEGFSRTEALRIVLEYQRMMQGGSAKGADSG